MKKTEKTVRIAHTVKRTPFSASVLFHREARRWVQVLMSGVRYLDAAGWLSVPEHVRQLKGLQQQTAVFMTLTGEEADRPRRQQQWQYLQQHCAPLPGEVLVFIGGAISISVYRPVSGSDMPARLCTCISVGCWPASAVRTGRYPPDYRDTGITGDVPVTTRNIFSACH
ncbi:hypothetical protein GVS48_21910 [Salmonella enterica]|nr:hypothetical protein [Salmonella enterica]